MTIGGYVQSHNLNNLCSEYFLTNWSLFGGDCLSKKQTKKKSNITVPKPEMTSDKKYRCPIDQEVYDDKKDYESHCHEEHDVL